MKRTLLNRFVIGYIKVFGVLLSVVGLILFFHFLSIALNPEATVEVNGVATSSLKAKILIALFPLVFIALGLLLSICSHNTLENIFIPKFLRYKKDA